jgi:hypothetical protein
VGACSGGHCCGCCLLLLCCVTGGPVGKCGLAEQLLSFLNFPLSQGRNQTWLSHVADLMGAPMLFLLLSLQLQASPMPARSATLLSVRWD